MNKKTNFLVSFFPSVMMLLLSFIQFFVHYNVSVVFFVLSYVCAYFFVFYYPYFMPLLVLFIAGVLIDIANDISFGLTSSLFLAMVIISYFERKYVPKIDFIIAYAFFLLNVFLSLIFIEIINLISATNFLNSLKFSMWSVCFFPPVFIFSKLYINLLKSENEY